MKHVNFLIALVVAVALPAIAWAVVAPDPATIDGTSVKFDFREQVIWLGGAIAAGAAVIIQQAFGLLPGPARWALKLGQLDQVLPRIVQSWIAQNIDAVASRATFTVEVKNKAIAEMTAMAVNTGNKFVLKTRDTLRDKLAARLQEYIDKNYPVGVG